jgi:NTE family protein
MATSIEPRQEGRHQGIGLALSGGGFRAMLFHLGSVWRLNEMGLLPSVTRISSVSGGSLLNGRLAVRWNRLRFEGGVAVNFGDEIARPVLKFAGVTMDVPAIVLGLVPFVDRGAIAAWYYKRYLVGGVRLNELPAEPRFVINAAHLPTATSWRFSQAYMACYRVGMLRNPDVPIATAMAASAGFPPFLSPVTLKLDPAKFERTDGADLFEREELRRTVPLSDGGVYDNLGLQTLEDFDEVLVSDAGGGLKVTTGPFGRWHVQMRRVLDTAVEQGRALRRARLIDEFRSGAKRGTLWRTKTDITNVKDCPAGPAFPVHPDWPFHIFAIRTRLNHFTEAERSHLVNWGYLVTDTVIRSWYLKDHPPPNALPFPRYSFEHAPPTGRFEAAGPVSGAP